MITGICSEMTSWAPRMSGLLREGVWFDQSAIGPTGLQTLRSILLLCRIAKSCSYGSIGKPLVLSPQMDHEFAWLPSYVDNFSRDRPIYSGAWSITQNLLFFFSFQYTTSKQTAHITIHKTSYCFFIFVLASILHISSSPGVYWFICDTIWNHRGVKLT